MRDVLELPLETERQVNTMQSDGWDTTCPAPGTNGHPGPFQEDELDSKTGSLNARRLERSQTGARFPSGGKHDGQRLETRTLGNATKRN